MDKLASPPAPLSERRISLICGLLAMTGAFNMTLYIPALPAIVNALHTTDFSVKMTVTIFYCTLAFSQLVCGPLSDAFGRRPVIISFAILTTIGAVLAALSNSVELLLVARGIQGFGAGIGNSTTRAVIRDLFTGHPAARALNFMSLMVGIGPVFAPIIGGMVVVSFDWRAVLVLGAAYTTFVTLVVIFFLPETNANRSTQALRIRRIVSGYLLPFSHPRFVRAGLTAALAAGLMPLFPTLLPFILLEQFQVSMATFGMMMGLHAGVFVLGASVTRLMLRRFPATILVPIGIRAYLLTGIVMAIVFFTFPTSMWALFTTICFMTFCVPVMVPGLQSDAIADFGQTAGVVASLIGLLQSIVAFLATTTASLVANPSAGLAIVCLAMSLAAAAIYLPFRSHPDVP